MSLSDDLRARIAEAETPRHALHGLWFHGTGEPFESALRPGDYDGVLWCADNPAIAQAYIPDSGITAILSAPQPWERDERIRPSRDGTAMAVIRSFMNLPEPDVTYDAYGQAVSWSLPKGWPTWRHLEAVLAEHGYHPTASGIYNLKEKFDDGRSCIMPAAWRLPGRLFIIERPQGLNLLDISTGEPDLTDKQYHRLDLFADARAKGYHGVIIDDFAQMSGHGNVPHRSYGLFEEAVRTLSYEVIAATHFAWDDTALDPMTTPEFEAWRTELRQDLDISPRF